VKYSQMSDSECLDVLQRARLGRLGCASGNQPYVIPVAYIFEDGFVYGFATLGRKVEWIRANPLVCLEVGEITDFDDWVCVIVFGRYEEIGEGPEWQGARAKAARLFIQHGDWLEPAYEAARVRAGETRLEPVLYRIRAEEITGRRSRPFAPGIY